MCRVQNVKELAVPDGDLIIEEGHDPRGKWVRVTDGNGGKGRKVYMPTDGKVYGPRNFVAPPANLTAEADR